MNTPKKLKEDYFPSDPSEFSQNYNKMDSQIENLREQIRGLEKKIEEQKLQIQNREMTINAFTQKIVDIKKLKNIENFQEGTIEFAQKKLALYEEIDYPDHSFPLSVAKSILDFDLSNLREQFNAKLDFNERKISRICQKLKFIGKCVKNNNNKSKKIEKAPDLSLEKLLEAFNGFKNQLNPKQNSKDLIYMDGYEIKFNIPIDDFKRCLFYLLQGEDIVKTFQTSLLSNFHNTKQNLKNFQRIIEMLPKDFNVFPQLKKDYLEIIEQLKEVNNTLQKECPKQLHPANFKDQQRTQEILKETLEFYKEMNQRFNKLQDQITGLFPLLEELVGENFIQLKKVRGNDIITSK